MNTLFIHYLTFSRPIGYILVFFGMMIEGDLFLLSTSFLTRLGYFDIFDFIGVVLLGTIIGDSTWYWIGNKFGEGNNKISQYLIKRVSRININFENNFFWKLLLSKFMYGTHHASIAFIGIKRIKFTKYLIAEIPATIIWLLIIGGLGYFLGSVFSLIKHYLKFVEIGVLLIVALYIIAVRIIKKQSNLEH